MQSAGRLVTSMASELNCTGVGVGRAEVGHEWDQGGEKAIGGEQGVADLELNRPECCLAREAYVVDYRLGPPEGITLARLERRAPFIAQELRRQGLLVRGDT